MAYGLTQSLTLVAASSQAASVADTAVLRVTGDLTMECWFNFTTTTGTHDLISKWDSSGAGNKKGYQLDFDSNTIRLEISSNGTTTSTKSVAWTPSTGTWYHIAGVYTAAAGTADFYIDGVQQGTQQSGLPNSINANAAGAGVGARNFGGTLSDFANGKISLARIWSVARTGVQINANKCNVLGATAGLVAEWTLDNTYNDNSGNSLTLTSTGSPSFGASVPSVCAPSTSIKTWDGLAIGSVKTINGLALSSIKSVIGLT